MIIGGTTVKAPTKFDISIFNITKGGRTTSGKMELELVTQKRKFKLDYNLIKESDMRTILTRITSQSLFFSIVYPDGNSTSTATVYVGEISRGLMLNSGDNSLWTGFGFDLIEQ